MDSRHGPERMDSRRGPERSWQRTTSSKPLDKNWRNQIKNWRSPPQQEVESAHEINKEVRVTKGEKLQASKHRQFGSLKDKAHKAPDKPKVPEKISDRSHHLKLCLEGRRPSGVLDFGCGQGEFTREMAKLGLGKVYGADLLLPSSSSSPYMPTEDKVEALALSLDLKAPVKEEASSEGTATLRASSEGTATLRASSEGTATLRASSEGTATLRASSEGAAALRASFVLVDAENKTPLEEGSVDLVTFFMSLHHMTKIETAIAEALRVLRPGGAIFVREHDAPPSLWDFLDAKHASFPHAATMPVHRYYTRAELCLIFAKFNFYPSRHSFYPPSLRNPQAIYHSLFTAKEVPTPNLAETGV